MSLRRKVLVVDASVTMRETCAQVLRMSHEVNVGQDLASGLASLDEDPPDVLVVDWDMPDGEGRTLTQRALSSHPGVAVIVTSQKGDLKEFIGLLRLGVCDYIFKPFRPEQLRQSVQRALEMARLQSENERLKARLRSEVTLEHLIGESPAMQAVKEQVHRVGPTDTTVLITGSSGTGKELVASAIHDVSERAQMPFVVVNCGALPQQLMESELFGHVKGAFTGAVRSRAGRFEEAAGGTLFLDEIGTMSEAVQVRMLRVLGERELTRVGGEAVIPIDVRIVGATNANLEKMVKNGTFREDLYYRLNVFPIKLPELKERLDDIGVLSGHLLASCCKRIGRPPKRLTDEALAKLHKHSWPGNVRELENTIERAVILSGEEEWVGPEDILIGSLPQRNGVSRELPAEGMDLPGFLAELEGNLIARALERTGQNKQQAANLLGLQRTTLVQKLRRRSANEAKDAGEKS